MQDTGRLEQISRGVYRLADRPPLENPDLVILGWRIPSGVVCLISAPAFHDPTTQIPHEVYLALSRGAKEPRLDFPRIRSSRFGGKSFTEGIAIHRLDGAPVRLYSPEKTLADSFTFRNKLGLDTAIEALRLYRERGNVKVDDLMYFAARRAPVSRPTKDIAT